MTVDDYLGKAIKPSTAPAPPPSDAAAAFRAALDRAIAIARERIAANPRDADSHYQLGAALGLRASYIATVDASVLGAFRVARSEEHTSELQSQSNLVCRLL